MKTTWQRIAFLGTGVLAGAIIAGTVGASAASSGSGSSGSGTSSSGSSTTQPADQFGSTPVRSDESAPGSSLVSQLTAKAEAKVPGATVYRVETDAGDAAYEAHMRKANGTLVTVKFDKSGNVTAVEDGMGQGDPMGPGGPGGPGDNDGDGPAGGASTSANSAA